MANTMARLPGDWAGGGANSGSTIGRGRGGLVSSQVSEEGVVSLLLSSLAMRHGTVVNTGTFWKGETTTTPFAVSGFFAATLVQCLKLLRGGSLGYVPIDPGLTALATSISRFRRPSAGHSRDPGGSACRPHRGYLLGLCVSVAVGSVALPALAEQRAARLTVDLGPGAKICADRTRIAERVNAMAGREAIREEADLGIVVVVKKSPSGFRAVLQFHGPRQGTRELIDATAGCVALGEAIAITIALVLDEEVENAPPIRITPKPAKRRIAPPALAEPAPRPAVNPSFTFDILAVQTAGLISGSNFAIYAGVDYFLGAHATLGVFGLGVVPDRIVLPQGRLRVTLGMAGVPLCYTTRTADRSLGLGLCGFAAFGAVVAQGQGLDRNETATVPWAGAGGSVAADGPMVGPINFVGRVTALVPLPRTEFEVENLGSASAADVGVVYQAPPFGIGVGFGIRANIP